MVRHRSVLSTSVATRIGRRFSLATMVIVALSVNTLGALTVAVAPEQTLAMLGMAVLSGSQTVIFINLIALRQRIVPARMQGRVNATARALAVSGGPIGAFATGLLVRPLGGVRVAFGVLGFLALLNSVAAVVSPLRTANQDNT